MLQLVAIGMLAWHMLVEGQRSCDADDVPRHNSYNSADLLWLTLNPALLRDLGFSAVWVLGTQGHC